MLDADNNAFIAANASATLCITPRMANRHGLITGATGTGKTVTLQTMAEAFSLMGVPVFMTDIKGDLSGIGAPGAPKGKIAERIAALRLPEQGYKNRAFPVCFWDAFGQKGHPLRVTVSDLGPVLLSRMLNLNEVQSGVMSLVFRIADEEGMLLLDFKDLRSMIRYVGDHRAEYQISHGSVPAASVGAIQRALLRLEEEGADTVFGEPCLDMFDLLQTDSDGRGVINVLASDRLSGSPAVYSMLLLWLLGELFEHLPEVGDRDKPKLVFFFDEAHMLFDNASPVLLQKIEQVVRLIRSRGVGLYFVTQNPADVPDEISAQLGNRVQHALRAFTPKEQKAVRAAAETFRANPNFDTEKAIGELAVGEALVSFLDADGRPAPVERAYILPPEGRVGPIEDEARAEIMAASLVAGVYDTAVDRESAYELLAARAVNERRTKQEAEDRKHAEKQAAAEAKQAAARAREEAKEARAEAREAARLRKEEEKAKAESLEGIAISILKSSAKSAARSAATGAIKKAGKQIARGIFGNILGGLFK